MGNPRDQLAAVVDSGLVRVRVARLAHRCRRADRNRPGWYVLTSYGPGHWSKTYRIDRDGAEWYAEGQQTRNPEAAVTIGQDLNPDYSPDCPSPDIKPGDVYGEYIGEAAAYQSGLPYCAACAAVVWPAS